MILDTGMAVEEELFYQNDQTRRIYYRKSDTSDVLGTCGYLACSYVDDIDDDILSWFDSARDAPAAAARFRGIYRGIFDGFKGYFLSRRGGGGAQAGDHADS
jgi:hypothetical protein